MQTHLHLLHTVWMEIWLAACFDTMRYKFKIDGSFR